jgi:hypothetical protein
VNILKIKDSSSSDVNLLYLGKILDHSQTFGSQGVVENAKIILTLKKSAQIKDAA